MNQVALVGNVTDDPELRYTQSGAAVAGFTVAVSHRSKQSSVNLEAPFLSVSRFESLGA